MKKAHAIGLSDVEGIVAMVKLVCYSLYGKWLLML